MTDLDRNALNLGLFGANLLGGLATSTFPDRWEATWKNTLSLAPHGGDAEWTSCCRSGADRLRGRDATPARISRR